MTTTTAPMDSDLPRALRCVAAGCNVPWGKHPFSHPFLVVRGARWDRIKRENKPCGKASCHESAAWSVSYKGVRWCFCSKHAVAVPGLFDLKAANRPATKKDEDRHFEASFREFLTKISHLLELPGSPDLTQLHVHLEAQIRTWKKLVEDLSREKYEAESRASRLEAQVASLLSDAPHHPPGRKARCGEYSDCGCDYREKGPV